MANFANPTVNSNYTDFPTEIRNSVNAALRQLSVDSHTNIPAGAIKWDSTDNRWKKFNNGAFVDLTDTYDLNADVTVTGLNLGDSKKIVLGADEDLEIEHDTNDSIIRHTGTGRLKILANNNVRLQAVNNQGNTGDILADFTGDGSVDLYQNGNKRFETTTNGAKITDKLGVGLDVGSNVSLDVNGNAQIGSTDSANILTIGRISDSNRFAQIHFVGDTTFTDFGYRIRRLS